MIEHIVAQFVALIKPLQEFTKERREQRDNALRAILQALNETRIYYRVMERGAERDFDVENQLVKYWEAAAIPVRHIDENLAMLCREKSQYWINPEIWTSSEMKERGILLADLQKKYSEILFPSIIRKRSNYSSRT